MKKTIALLLLGLFAFAAESAEKMPLPMPKNARLIDVRTPEEFKTGALPGAVNIPHDQAGVKVPQLVKDKKTPLYLYCRSGRRVQSAMKVLKEKGYTVIWNLGGLEEAGKKLKLRPVTK